MGSKLLAFKSQVEAFKTGRYNLKTAEIVVANLISLVASNDLTWGDLGTTKVELEVALAQLKRKLNQAQP
jgi:hypothetical protein